MSTSLLRPPSLLRLLGAWRARLEPRDDRGTVAPRGGPREAIG